MSGNVLCGEPDFGKFFTNKLSVGDLFDFETFGKGLGGSLTIGRVDTMTSRVSDFLIGFGAARAKTVWIPTEAATSNQKGCCINI